MRERLEWDDPVDQMLEDAIHAYDALLYSQWKRERESARVARRFQWLMGLGCIGWRGLLEAPRA